jgi:hypothetical protein
MELRVSVAKILYISCRSMVQPAVACFAINDTRVGHKTDADLAVQVDGVARRVPNLFYPQFL